MTFLSKVSYVYFDSQVRAAISALRYHEQYPRLPADFEVPAQRNLDMFDLLEFVFGFQVWILPWPNLVDFWRLVGMICSQFGS